MRPYRDRLQEFISRRVLDFAETLPRFQGGPVANFQRIREHQRKRAVDAYERRKGLEGESLEVVTISFAGFYEFEQFATLNSVLGRLFDGAKIEDRIKKIRASEESLDGASWSNLGSICRSKPKFPFPNTTFDARLPEDIDSVTISHHRILPSLAALEIRCRVSPSFKEKHAQLAKIRYLPTLVTSSLRPTRFLKGYSISGETEFEEKLDAHLEQVCTSVRHWLARKLGRSVKCLRYTSTFPWYRLSLADDETSFRSTIASRRDWLRPYGFSDSPYDLYSSDEIAFSLLETRRKSKNFGTLFSGNDEDQKTNIAVDCALRGIVPALVLSAMIERCRSEIETLRSKAFNRIMTKGSSMLRSGKTIQSLKFSSLRVKRFEFELKNSQVWVQHSLDEAGVMETTFDSQISTFAKNFVSGTQNRIKTILDSSGLLEEAISERLQIESIIAMHGLQRVALFLALVGLLVAVIQLGSGWPEITDLLLGYTMSNSGGDA